MPTQYLLLLCLEGFLLPSLHAQNVLQGRVTDAETSRPLEAVMVSVLRDSMTIDYTLTDADGRYSLPWRHKGTLQVSASMLGYGRQTRDVGKGGRLDFALRTESIVLREVEIRPGRISSRRDTVRYNLADFITEKDTRIRDVLKRLPGIDVKENGTVTYKGKPFYTYYHANCGGGTDDAKSWTGSSAPTIKPLRGASCSYDSHSKSYSWSKTVPQKSINAFVNKNGLKGNVKKIAVGQKSPSKRAETLVFTTSSGKKELSCPKFRLSVGSSVLRSCKITDIDKAAGGFKFSGHGYGHGVGMCQDGAKGMAQDNKDYKKILSNYFPSSKITEQ